MVQDRFPAVLGERLAKGVHGFGVDVDDRDAHVGGGEVTDALICQYEGGERGLLHYSATLNELRFSRDPVALDVLSVEELERQRKKADAPTVKPNVDLYRNAGLLELGVDDLKRIQVKRIEMSQ